VISLPLFHPEVNYFGPCFFFWHVVILVSPFSFTSNSFVSSCGSQKKILPNIQNTFLPFAEKSGSKKATYHQDVLFMTGQRDDLKISEASHAN